MESKTVSGIMLTLLLTSVLILAFNIQTVKAIETIYIRPDGSIDPPTAPIHRDGEIYDFTANIYDSIVVQRDDIVVDGNEFILQGPGTRGFSLFWRHNVTIKNVKIRDFIHGIWLEECSNIEIRENDVSSTFNGIYLKSSVDSEISENRLHLNELNGIVIWLNSNNNTVVANEVSGATYGVYLCGGSKNNNVTRNKMNSNGIGIHLLSSHNNKITENDASFNWDTGIAVEFSDNNKVVLNNASSNSNDGIILAFSKNNIVARNEVSLNNVDFWNSQGISIYGSRTSNNTIRQNTISSNMIGVLLLDCGDNIILENTILSNLNHAMRTERAHGNSIYHNNFAENAGQIYNWEQESVNIWDDGYPSGGNYWSDYSGADSDRDGIGDTPYTIDANNQDNYPLVVPWPFTSVNVDFQAWNRGKWVPAYIELQPLSVGDIDISTVRLNDTISIGKPTAIGDYDSDGIPDLMVKFDRAELLDWLAAIGWPQRGGYYFVTLTIEGKLTDGKYFRGYEFVQLFIKSK